jgi:HD superfamily phosphodiesterase
LLAKRSDLLKDRIAFEVKRYFKDDFKRIGHIARVAGYAEQLGKQQKGDLGAIMSAAYLHEVGAVQSLADSIKPNPDYQDLNAAVAYAILTDLGAQESLKQEVCHIIEMFYQNKVSEDPNFQAFYLAHEKAEHLTTKES